LAPENATRPDRWCRHLFLIADVLTKRGTERVEIENQEDVLADLESKERYLFTTLVVLLGVPFVGVFIISDLLSGRYVVALVCMPVLLLIGIGMPAIRRLTAARERKARFFTLFCYAFLILVGILILFLILSEGYSRAPWFYLFPLLAFLILGHRAGVLLTAIFFFALVVSEYLFPNARPVLISDLRTRFFISILFISVISYFLERWRNDYKNALILALRDVKESEQRYRKLVTTMQEGLAGVDADWRIAFVNERFAEMSGYRHSELMGRPFLDFFNIPAGEKAGMQQEKSRNGKMGTYELELVRRDGKPLFVLCSFNPSYDENGECTGGFSVLADITERTLSARKLHKSEERYRFLAENMGDVVWTLDMDLKTTYVSPSVEKLLGVTPAQRKGQKLEEMVAPGSIERIANTLLRELAKDQRPDTDRNRTVSVEVEYYHQDGSSVWVENQVKAMRGENGEIIGIYGVSRDITERKKVQDALIEEKEKLKEALSQIKTLTGLLPICSSCKKIRDDKGYWNQIEGYIQQHSDAEFSHSICPACMKKLYPGLTKISSGDNGRE
jgi:PAS domain S-box-containing protein